MQLQEILSLLKIIPMYYYVIVGIAFILSIVSAVIMFKADTNDNETAFNVSLASLTIFFATAIGVLIYIVTSQNSAMQSAKITRSGDKIHIESSSEFMKSVDLDVLAEKDGYIVVEFENKTYRIEDLSKKGN